jgi:cytoskeleton protein RodZ
VHDMLRSMTDDHDQLDPAEALMREVGAQLRHVRLERGEELDDVARHLRIKATYLFGIEQGDLSTMPGRTYALGFLRSYADYLGFDGDDLIVQIKSTVANLTDRTRLRIRTPLPESRLPKMPILVLSLAAIAGVYAGWSYLNRGSEVEIETVAEVPNELRSPALDAVRDDDGSPASPPRDEIAPEEASPAPGMAEQPASQSAGAPPAAAAQPRPDSRSAVPSTSTAAAEPSPVGSGPTPTTGPTGSGGPAGPAATEVEPGAGPSATTRAFAAAGPEPVPTATPPAEPAPGAAERTAGARSPAAQDPTEAAGGPRADSAFRTADADAAIAQDQVAALPFDPTSLAAGGRIHEEANRDARVVLRAVNDSWIRVSSVGGDYLRDRTLERGDLFLVPNRPDLELWTGNAGGLEVIVDGDVLAPLGSSGAVVRAVPLEPASLRATFGSPIDR